jgi:transposase-like protein
MREYTPERGDRIDFAVLDLHYAIGLAAENNQAEIRETLERIVGVFEAEADIIAGRVFEKCGHPRSGHNALRNGTNNKGLPNYTCRNCQRARSAKYTAAQKKVKSEVNKLAVIELKAA